jgi:hypothetical protein
MMTSSSLTELRLAALALWKHQRQDLERSAARQAAERALDVFGDTAGPLGDPDSWQGNADGDAVAVPPLDADGEDRLEYDHTFDEQLWLRSNCPSCGGAACRITPIGSLLELGQALDHLQEARAERGEEDGDAEGSGEPPGGAPVDQEVDPDDLPGACDACDESNSPAQRLYQAVLDAIEEAGESEDEDEDAGEAIEPSARGRG